MKKIISGISALLLISTNANALTFTFSDKDFLGGASWGTMTIDQINNNTLSIQYNASNDIPSGAQATGFGFAPNLGGFSISNPASNDLDWDQDDLTWLILDNLNPIPQPSNADQFLPDVITKDTFNFGATEGNQNNINVPGITAGTSDIFYLNFANNTSLSDIQWVGVRLQGFQLNDADRTNSLFLIGGTPTTPVPEPATMLLFGTGLIGLAGLARRKEN